MSEGIFLSPFGGEKNKIYFNNFSAKFYETET